MLDIVDDVLRREDHIHADVPERQVQNGRVVGVKSTSDDSEIASSSRSSMITTRSYSSLSQFANCSASGLLLSYRCTLLKFQSRNISHSTVERAITPVPMMPRVPSRVPGVSCSAASA